MEMFGKNKSPKSYPPVDERGRNINRKADRAVGVMLVFVLIAVGVILCKEARAERYMDELWDDRSLYQENICEILSRRAGQDYDLLVSGNAGGTIAATREHCDSWDKGSPKYSSRMACERTNPYKKILDFAMWLSVTYPYVDSFDRQEKIKLTEKIVYTACMNGDLAGGTL